MLYHGKLSQPNRPAGSPIDNWVLSCDDLPSLSNILAIDGVIFVLSSGYLLYEIVVFSGSLQPFPAFVGFCVCQFVLLESFVFT